MKETEFQQNLDPSEQEKFNEIAGSWWDPEGPFRPLHDLNPARMRFVTERAEVKGSRVLDVGCGGGILSEAMARAGAHVTGIDVASRVLSIARLHLLESGLEVNYQELTAEQIAHDMPGQFDVVACMEMLEHVPDPASIIHSIETVLKPGGQAFFSTLNRTPLAFALGIVGAEHIARLLPKGTHRYDRFIRPSELCRLLRQSGFETGDIMGLHYNPMTRSVRLGGSVSVNYLVAARKPSA